MVGLRSRRCARTFFCRLALKKMTAAVQRFEQHLSRDCCKAAGYGSLANLARTFSSAKEFGKNGGQLDTESRGPGPGANRAPCPTAVQKS